MHPLGRLKQLRRVMSCVTAGRPAAVLASLGVMGVLLLPMPQAQAKWVKVTIQGTITGGDVYPSDLGLGDNFTWSLGLNNFQGSNPAAPGTATWSQGDGLGPPYLFDLQPLVGGTGITGPFTASPPDGGDSFSYDKQTGVLDFSWNRVVGGAPLLTYGGLEKTILNLAVQGELDAFNGSNQKIFLADFIEDAISSSGQSTFSCASIGSCLGVATPASENQLLFDWSQISFEVQPDPVPAPLPALGALSAFGFSRRLRTRIRAVRSTPKR